MGQNLQLQCLPIIPVGYSYVPNIHIKRTLLEKMYSVLEMAPLKFELLILMNTIKSVIQQPYNFPFPQQQVIIINKHFKEKIH